MALLAAALGPTRANSWSADDDRWYMNNLGLASDAGVRLSAESILNCGAVLAAVRFLSDAWAMCPPSVRRRTVRGREEAPTHYAQRVLRNPNAWQTGYRWRHVNMTWASTWGNAFNRIVPGPRSFADQLRPMHPSRVTVKEQRPDGTLVYEYRGPDGRKETLGQEQVLHFRGLSTDGVSGVKIYALIRNVVGIALAAEKHVSTFLRKGSRLSGLVVPTVPAGTMAMGKPERDELRESLNSSLGGVDNTGSFGVLPFGLDIKTISSNNREGQVLELSDQAVGAILRFLGVPGVVCGYGEKTATYASADAFFEKGGIKHCVQPWVTNFEQEVEKALLFEDDDHYIRYNLDVLLRANTKDRYDALFKACGGPWLSRNRVREIEDENPDPNPEMDEVLTPSNMAAELQDELAGKKKDPAGDGNPPPPPPRNRQPEPADDDQADAMAARARLFALDAAARVVRREVAAVKGANGNRGAAIRFAGDPEGWKGWVAEHYAKHASYVAETMRITDDVARTYCERQAATLLELGAAVVDIWPETAAADLASLALGE